MITPLPSFLYKNISPLKCNQFKLVLFNNDLAKTLDTKLLKLKEEDLLKTLCGQNFFFGENQYATVYTGHQFGHLNPKLGDGRAIFLGERNHFEIQLKGSGPTPFSRGGDGLCPLGPAIREYIISEYMAAVGIKTTRSLSVCLNGHTAYRDEELPAAGMIRVAESHLRIGHFEFFFHTNQINELEALFNYSLEKIQPALKNDSDKVLKFFRLVSQSLIELINKWMSIGFIHGVMNTDNMALSGETIDYGPCAFMEEFNPNKVFSSIDRNGRYAYNQQQNIVLWNLSCLALALSPLLQKSPKECEEIFTREFSELADFQTKHWCKTLGKKFGLEDANQSNFQILNDFLKTFKGSDMTNSFSSLAERLNSPKSEFEIKLRKIIDSDNSIDFKEIMKKNNPQIVPRNHHVEEAIEKAYQGDFRFAKKLVKAVQDPFIVSEENRYLTTPALPNQKVKQTFCGT